MTQTEQQHSPQAQAALRGMRLAGIAAEAPDRVAIVSKHGGRTFGELNANANRLARALRRRGLGAGDALGLACANRPEFSEALSAAQRTGIRTTPVNWHLTGEEIAYVLQDCEAKAFVADARFRETVLEASALIGADVVRLAIGGQIPGFERYEDALAAESGGDIDDPQLGGTMLYTSGTTGRPKGVHRPRGGAVALAAGAQAAEGRQPNRRGPGYVPGEDAHLLTGPAYHAAPLAFSLNGPLMQGVAVVMMDGWDAEETLQLIERHRITHTHMVPTMFHRLLALPDEVKRRYDLSSLRYVLHGAAPCPAEVKKALIDWLGPIVYEYYAATEGGGTSINPEEWLRKPGSVGKPNPGQTIEVRDDLGSALPTGEVGTVWFKAPERGRFEYYKDAQKTAAAYTGDFFTLGDMGYFDADGYLFLTGRSAEVIISGGVNIYPAEIDAVLLQHPAVADVACVGVPNADWGEEVKAVVQLKAGVEKSEALADELTALARDRLARYKCPRSVDFDDKLPRHETGKIYRRLVRDRYWQGRLTQI